jgi:copper transport protein
LLAGIGVLGFSLQADAHALVRASVPAAGATLDRSPDEVSITFTERPDPKLSRIRVLNEVGRQIDAGGTQPDPGDPLTLKIPLPPLPNGVYTVNWRTVSEVDGHLAGGSFAYGVGVTPIGSPSPPGSELATTPPPTPLGLVARWGWFVSLSLLLGAAWVSAFGFRVFRQPLALLAAGGGGLAIVSLLALAESQRAQVGLSWSQFFGASLGAALLWRAIPIVAAVLAVSTSFLIRGRGRLLALGLAGICTAGAMLSDVLASHAAASSVPLVSITIQWTHFAAAGVWIGGLAALMVGTRGQPSDSKALAVRRFSSVAGLAVAAVALTGLLRAMNEVGSWGKLLSTAFGWTVLVKVVLLLVLLSLGAFNRYFNVPQAALSLVGLRRVSRVELGVAAMVLAATALLTSLAPPSSVTVTAAPPPRVVVSGNDYATSVKVRLEVSPGYPGLNQFTVTVVDFDTGRPFHPGRVALRFRALERDIGESMLELKAGSDGVFQAQGRNISLAGRWQVFVLVQKGPSSVEVPLSLTTNRRPQKIHVSQEPGQLALYTIDLPQLGSVQAYVDPGKPGVNQVHWTFFDTKGNELPVGEGTSLMATPSGGAALQLPVTRFSSGHFIAQANLVAGTYRFEVMATASDGTPLQAYFEQAIK